jgi:hypothetical protein
MPGVCTICGHSQRLEIEAAIAAAQPYRRIAVQYTVSPKALARHKEHVAEKIAEARKGHDAEAVITVMGDLDWVREEARNLYQQALLVKDLRTANSMLENLVRQTKRHAELTGELDQRTQVNIQQTQDWMQARHQLQETLNNHPDTKAQVLRMLDAG